jgi:hypothetical protein
MPIIPGVPTDDGRKYYSQFFGGLRGVPSSTTVVTAGPVTVQWNPLILYFKVGEGGWIDPGSGKVPRTPDSALRRFAPDPLIQDIDAIVDATRGSPRYDGNPSNPTYSRGSFQKTLAPSDLTWETLSILRVSCLLDFGDFNEDYPASGRNPEIWEIGIFAQHPEIVTPAPAGQLLMVGYGTFPMQTKNAGIQIENIVRLIF